MSYFKTTLNCSHPVHMHVDSNNQHVYELLRDEFAFDIPGAEWSKKHIRNGGNWDGKIRMFNIRTQCLPRGLANDALKLLKRHNIGEINVVGVNKPVDHTDEFYRWLETKKLPYDPDPEQIEAALVIINKKRRVIESPTSSGKTFINYLAFAFLIEVRIISKLLVVVPTTQLRTQFVDDFTNEMGFDPVNIHAINSKKDNSHKITVSTWQSIYKLDHDWFAEFDALLIDETHLAEAKSLSGIAEKCSKAHYRIGVTGSLRDGKVSDLVLRGHFGPVYTAITAQELVDRGRTAKLSIDMVKIEYSRLFKKYPEKFKHRFEYQDEVKFITSIRPRDKIVFKLLEKHPNTNRLVLFRHTKHGRRMYMEYKKLHPEENVFYVDGGVGSDRRTDIQQFLDADRNSVLFASLGTTSTGISIKHLDYGIIASSVKSKTTVLQMIGRFLRVSDTKTSAHIYDLYDAIIYGKQKRTSSYSYKHAMDRLNRYSQLGLKISDITMII